VSSAGHPPFLVVVERQDKRVSEAGATSLSACSFPASNRPSKEPLAPSLVRENSAFDDFDQELR
jgi:hypothetical protein